MAPVPHILHVMREIRSWMLPSAPSGPWDPGNPASPSAWPFRATRHEGQGRIQVRLVGWKRPGGIWMPAGTVSGPSGGTYRFEARAAQPDGDFGPVVTFPFEVLPRWWRTWWAMALWGLGAIGAMLLILRLRMAALAKSTAELETLVAERTEELSHRNVELTDALGRVKQLSGSSRSVPPARRSAMTAATGINWSSTSATTPTSGSPTASARSAWKPSSRDGPPATGIRTKSS